MRFGMRALRLAAKFTRRGSALSQRWLTGARYGAKFNWREKMLFPKVGS